MVTKQQIAIHIICIDTPVACADNNEVRFGVQDKNKQLRMGAKLSPDACLFEFELTVRQHTDGSPNFTGSFAHGSRADRFIYLSYMRLVDETWKIINRIKVPLKTITWEQVHNVWGDDERLLQVKVCGKTTGTVPLLEDGWIVQSRGRRK